MKKKSAEDYLDKLLNSVNDEKVKKEKFRETAKMLEDAMSFWEKEGAYLNFEDASYMQATSQKPVQNASQGEKKSGQEDFLDALLSGAQNTEFGMNKRKPDNNPMYSRRVSKSEADFLREFEAELANSEEDFSDLFADFDKAIEPEDRLEEADIYVQPEEQTAPVSEDGFSLGDVDLAALVDEAAGVIASQPVESTPVESYPVEQGAIEEISDDVFASLFGDGELNLAEEIPMEPVASEGLDLGNLGEEDLMNLLAGTEELSDIGNMLSSGEITEIPLEELDAFAVFAENEMHTQQVSADPVIEELETEKGKKKAGKGSLIDKLKGILSSFLKDDDDDEVTMKPASAPTAEVLSGENADILAELESLEEKPSKKEKKKKEKRAKKEKAPKKPKAPKAPKPEKEKKPKEVDNTPPLPKGPVVMIWVMAASLVALVLLGVNVIKYNAPLTNAKNLQSQGHYAEAFAKLNGLEIQEKDMEFYNQLAILSTVDSELNAYEAFTKAEMPDKAFDSLICAAGRCYINEESADVYGCGGVFGDLKVEVSNELKKYQMTYDEAIEMYTIRHRDDYTIALYKKLTELGIDWE